MIEIHINKDIGSYEPRLIGPLSARQTVCVAIGAPVCYFIYKYTSPILTSDVASFLLLLPAAIAVAFGWIKPYGMKMEKFVQSVFINMVLAPANRKYKTVNVHEKAFSVLERFFKEQEEAEANKPETKSKKIFMPKNKIQTKPRYVVSPEAVK